MNQVRIAIVLVGLALAACGGSHKAAEPPTPTGGGEGGGGEPAEGPLVGPPTTKWDDLTHDQKMAYMKHAVLPKAKEMFGAYDPQRFAEVNCMTCHGDGATDGTFKMPNPKLPHLPGDMAGFQKLAAEKPEAMKFMGGQVKPTIAGLLGEPELDPAHPEKGGFGCAECHVLGGD